MSMQSEKIKAKKAAVVRDREANPNHMALFNCFVPMPRFKTLSKFITDKHGNRVRRPEPVTVSVPTTSEEENNE